MRRKKEGSVAQLNRASDYGSEGYGFESHRSHKAIQQQLGGFFLCMLALLRRYGALGVPFVHMIANMGSADIPGWLHLVIMNKVGIIANLVGAASRPNPERISNESRRHPEQNSNVSIP